MDLKLNDKRVLVTGSSSGIGVAVAKVLLEEGASVVVHGRQVEKTHAVADSLRRLGDVKVALGDLATDEGADATARMALDAFGGIDILINNAGGASYSQVGFFNIPPKEWVTTHGMNVISTVNMIHRLTPPMQARKWGRIINMASTSAHSNLGSSSAYATCNSALLNLTLGLAKTLKDTGITVNAVSPGMIMTDKIEVYIQSIGQREGFTGPDARQQAIDLLLRTLIPQTVGRMGEAEDIAYMCAFLCGPQADFISAGNFRVDGGASPASN